MCELNVYILFLADCPQLRVLTCRNSSINPLFVSLPSCYVHVAICVQGHGIESNITNGITWSFKINAGKIIELFIIITLISYDSPFTRRHNGASTMIFNNNNNNNCEYLISEVIYLNMTTRIIRKRVVMLSSNTARYDAMNNCNSIRTISIIRVVSINATLVCGSIIKYLIS